MKPWMVALGIASLAVVGAYAAEVKIPKISMSTGTWEAGGNRKLDRYEMIGTGEVCYVLTEAEKAVGVSCLRQGR